MKKGGIGLLKQIMAVLADVARSKSMALKSKTRAIQTRLIIYSLVKDKKVLLDPISNKLHSLVGGGDQIRGHAIAGGKVQRNTSDSETEQLQPLVAYSNVIANVPVNEELVNQMEVADEDYGSYKEEAVGEGEEDENDDFEEDSGGGSVIELVKNSKGGGGEEFRLEDDIDQVAEMFIRRFHHQMRLQRQNSLKNYHLEHEDMLQI